MADLQNSYSFLSKQTINRYVILSILDSYDSSLPSEAKELEWDIGLYPIQILDNYQKILGCKCNWNTWNKIKHLFITKGYIKNISTLNLLIKGELVHSDKKRTFKYNITDEGKKYLKQLKKEIDNSSKRLKAIKSADYSIENN